MRYFRQLHHNKTNAQSDLVSCHNKTEASRVTVTDSPNSETKLPRSYWSISTRGRHVPLAGPSPFFHVATCYTSASASAPHQFMRMRMQMRMSKLMRMFRMCGCGCEYSQHPYYRHRETKLGARRRGKSAEETPQYT
ncbi:hypothetical protein EVAR_30858_1 [Eumeta japonica]|uniref:Uncharacterized protein n=1 Tax=Eumeta variegata TaxID=151549 RepID=A0A4C1XQL8_EUMVA|nr:hypothetical protein EVAR_30858_1 [Eumeta japonica]